MRHLDKIKTDFNLIEIFKGGSIALIFKIGSILIGYIFYLLFSRLYGAEIVGIFSVCWSVFMIGTVLAKIGLDTSIVKFISESISTKNNSNTNEYRRIGLKIVVVSSVITSILVILLSKYISLLFFDVTEKQNIVRIVGLAIIPAAILSFNAESLRGLKNIQAFSYFQGGTAMLILTIFILLIYLLKLSPYYIFHGILLAYAVLMVLSFFSCHKNFNSFGNLDGGVQSSGINTKKILAVSLPMVLTNSLYMILNWTDIMMIGYFKSEDLVGIYNIAVKVAALNVIGLSSVNAIAAPKFAELYAKKDHIGLRKVVKQSTLINILISFPILVIILFFPDFLLSMFGDDFVGGKTPLYLLAIGQFYHAMGGATLILLNMTGKEKTGRNIIIVGAILNLALNYFLIPRYGITGAAFSTMLSTVFWKSLSLIYVYKYHRFLTFPIKINA